MAPFSILPFFEPTAAQPPCGRNLDYSPELLALETAAQEPEEPGIKDVEVVDARNWRDVLARAEKLLHESRDLRVAVLLTRALLRVEGIRGYCAGIALLKGLTERFWEGVYPLLEENGTDAVMRVNALRELWSRPTLADLRAAPLVSERALGTFSLNDVLVAKGQQKPKAGATAPAPAHVLKALEGIDPALLASVQEALENLKQLEALILQKVSGGPSLDPAPLREVLQRIAQILKEYGRASAPSQGGTAAAAGSPDPTQTTADAALAPATTAMVAMPLKVLGEVQTREDVLQMLDKIVGYYERHEPSSPVPLLMQRARRLATMNFLEIMRDLADKGLPQVEAVTGKESK